MIRSNIVKKALANNSRRVVKPKDGRPAIELLPWTLYQRQTVAVTAGQTLTYFRNINAATLLDSNMSNSGFLPYPQAFDLFAIAVAPEQGLPNADIENLINNTTVELRLSNKPYAQLPLFRVPAGGGLFGVSTENNINQVQNGLPSPSNTWSMAVAGMPLYIPSQQDFLVEIRIFNTVAFTATFGLTVYLDGVLSRPVL